MFRSRPAAPAAWLPFLLSILAVLAAAPALAADPVEAEPDFADTRLLRMPDIHGDTIVFVYAGDLWTVPAAGGQATRLTGSVGYLQQPKFSPDGRTIAFTGNYDGNDDVYAVPSAGGEPVRLTWHPGYDRVIDWQPDGKAVRFQSGRETRTGRDLQLFTVDATGGLPVRLALPEAGLSSWSPDGTRLAYNRISRELRTWKRYQGGMAQDIWIYDFKQNDTQRLTDWIGSDNFPMWHGDTIYFSSDRTGRLQIWAHDLKTGEQRQVTDHDEYDVKHPSLGTDAIVYENGGWLHVLDLATERTRKVTVSLYSDNTAARPGLRKVADLIGGGDLAPDAKRAVFEARGDIFTVPAEKGDVRNLTATPGIRERDPVWSPDGRWVAYLSDREGEYQVCMRAGDGSGEEKQLTKKAEAWQYGMEWSPDSKHLLLSDAAMNLWLVDAQSGAMKRIDKGVSDDIRQYAWSHDSAWVAYTRSEANNFSSIFLYDVAAGKSHRVTSDFTNDGQPCFDDEGKYLFFVSARHFNPTLGGYDLHPIWADMDGIYVATLRQDVPNPFPPESDEVEVEGEEKDKDEDADKKDEDEDEDADKKDGKDAKKAKKKPPVKIDIDGLADRLAALEVGPGNYYDLAFAGGKLFYMNRPFTPGGGRGNNRGSAAIKVYDLKKREEKTVLSPADGYTLSRDGKKLLYGAKGSFGIIDAKAEQKPAEKPLRTAEMQARVDPRAEWRQMFRDAWRQERDFFYDPGMHGVDWQRMYERYGQLIPYVSHGADFSYVVGELIGELNSSHSYVRPGDMPRPERIGTGLLGGDFALDRKSGRYTLDRILTERDWNGGTPTPLHGPGLEVNEGEYLLKVDGVELKAPVNPYSLLEGKVGKQVVLEVGPRADGKDSRTVTVVPVASEFDLRYEAWVQGNRRKVDELSGGKIGYLHMPNTAVGGQQGFAKGYYPNLRKEGLIIDERFNGGGFIPDYVMNIMRQKLVNLWKPRYGQDWRTPGTAFAGHLAMISNGYAGSGGDALPYYFKYYELGPVIGTRTWGGLVGISRGISLMDGGSVTFPEFGLFNMEGEWDVENYGVDPTVPIDNLPHEEIAGRDPQLEKAVEVLLQKIKDEPVAVPAVKEFPRDKY
ncbi:MAG: PDZ domain-containing protein [Candidatus Krumholzibacteriia bacterium]